MKLQPYMSIVTFMREQTAGLTAACQLQGAWIPAPGTPFYYGLLTRGRWRAIRQRVAGAWAVFRGRAVAVHWSGRRVTE